MAVQTAFLGLGSNLGDRPSWLVQTVDALHALPRSRVAGLSSLYETEPWGLKEQPAFLNAACGLETGLEASELVRACQEIENRLQRQRQVHWGPRTVDIDLLVFGRDIIHTQGLQVPHPRLAQRRFVLVPLAELAPALFIPGLDRTVEALLAVCPDQGGVTLYAKGVEAWQKRRASRMSPTSPSKA